MTVTPSARSCRTTSNKRSLSRRDKRGIGLIEHQHAGALADGPRDLDELHLGDREPVDPRIRIERAHAETFERGARFGAHHRPGNQRGDGAARPCPT